MSRTSPLRFCVRFTAMLAIVGALIPLPALAQEGDSEPAADAPALRERRSSDGEDAPNAFVLEGAMRVDVQRLDRYQRTNRVVRDESDSGRDVFGSLYLGLMFGISDNIRLGGGFGWGGSLTVNPDEGDTVGLGQLLFLDVRLDVLLPVKRGLSVILTPSVGATIIAPGDELRTAINDARNTGYNTWRGPRFGLAVGADAGVRWEAASWFALRGTVGYAWSWSPLLRSTAESDVATAELDWTLTTHRLRIAVGCEVTF